MSSCGDHDRGENRSGARHIHKTQTCAEQEPAAGSWLTSQTQPSERPLEKSAQARNDQSSRNHQQHNDSDVPQQVRRKPERAQERSADEREDAEAHDETSHDQVGTPSILASRYPR
jgi:hypothetical protein